MLKPEAAVRRCSIKNVFLEISQNSQENTCARDSFVIKLQACDLQPYYKRVSDTGVFLWILQNSKNTYFYRTPLLAAFVFFYLSTIFTACLIVSLSLFHYIILSAFLSVCKFACILPWLFVSNSIYLPVFMLVILSFP